MKDTDFTINSRPVSISLICPHCGEEITIPWSELDPPEYWGDQWPDVMCPECSKDIPLGDYDYQ